MAAKLDEFVYPFGEIVLIGHRGSQRFKTTWYLKCPDCSGKHMFRQMGSKVWHTFCEATKTEWTITPREYYICKPIDLTIILGEENNDR